MNIQEHNEENKSSFSFEMQLDLQKGGYEFEDFGDFQPNKNDREKSNSNDEPKFNPRQLAIQRQASVDNNPFTGGSESASKDNTQSKLPAEQILSNPFVTPEGSSKTSQSNRLNKRSANQQPQNIPKRGQVTFGPSSTGFNENVKRMNSPKGIKSPQGAQSDSNFFTFKREPEPQRLSSSQQLVLTIQSVRSEIDYYRQAIKKQQYQSVRMAQKQLQMTYLNQQVDDRLAEGSKEIIAINEKVDLKSRQQEQLTKLYNSTYQDRMNLIDEIRSGLACEQQDTPTQEQYQLYEQLEVISKTLQQIELQNDQLQLSRLVSSIVPADSQPDNGTTMLSKVYELTQKIGCPKFSRNCKMACLKNRWVLWENSELHLGVLYHKKGKELVVECHLGNKSNKQLLQFTLIFDNDKEPFLNKVTLKQHSYMKVERHTENIIQEFIQATLSYELEITKPIINELLVPVVFLHFGEFEPINAPLFVKKWKKVESKGKSLECPIDKDIVGSLADIKKYLCNLVQVVGKNGERYLAGLFKFSCGAIQQHELAIKIKQRDSLLRFTMGSIPGPREQTLSRDTIAKLTNSLCFIFTI